MLTADLIPARRRGETLLLPKLDRRKRERLLALAEEVTALLDASVGQTRDVIDELLADVEVAPNELRLWRGVCKLAIDAATFEAAEGEDPVALRAALFAVSAATRRAASPQRPWQREAVVDAVAAELGIHRAALEQRLFADLPGTHALIATSGWDGARLAQRWELACHQSLLLRATRLRAELQTRDGGYLRTLFGRLKFHRLLWRCERLGDDRVALELDGPLSLFSQSTRYGMELAIVLPMICQAERWSITADVRWGKERKPLAFVAEGRRDRFGAPADAPALPDELQRLIDDLARADTGWSAAPAPAVHDVPGLGVFVADLVLTGPASERVLFELLGFWSRDAVFRRAELLRRGLGCAVVLAGSERLRVDRSVVDAAGAELVLYKGVLSARRVLEAAARAAAAVAPARQAP